MAFEDGRVGGGDPRGETRGEEDDDALSNDALSTATEKETEKTKNRRDNDVDVAYVTASTFDWNAVPSDQCVFDLVLACDVLYESHAVAPVASLVGTLTEKKNGVWLVADPPLRAPKNRARFLELVDAGGFETTSATRRTKVTHAGSTDVVLLLELRAKA